MYRKKILAKESFGMPRLAAALSITNTMNPHLFFHRMKKIFIPIEAAYRRLPRRPSLLGGGVAATELEQGIRKAG